MANLYVPGSGQWIKATANNDGVANVSPPTITPSVNIQSIADAALPCITPATSQKVAIGSGSAQSAAIAATVVRVVGTADCHLAFGANPTAVADGTCVFLPANVPEYFQVTSGNKLAVIQDSVAGNLYITGAA